MDRLVRLDEAAEIIAIPIGSIRSARKRGTLRLPIVKTGPRTLSVRQSDIDEVIAGRLVPIVGRKVAAKRLIESEGE